jgi:uncharacterized protein
MSQQNVEVVRACYDAWAAGELARLPEFLDPEVVWEAIENAPDAGTYRGYEGVRAYMEDWLEDFDILGMNFEEVIDAEGRLVIVQRGSATGKGSGLETEIHYAVVYTFRDGKLFRVKEYRSRAEALEAAGLRD